MKLALAAIAPSAALVGLTLAACSEEGPEEKRVVHDQAESAPPQLHAQPGESPAEEVGDMHTLEQLLEKEEPAWGFVQEWITKATNAVEVLPPVEEPRGAELLRIQVTTRSPMGALTYETGGLLIDQGWLRILGSGHPRLPRGLGSWNEEQTGSAGRSGLLLIADDAVGGFFAINGGGLPGAPGSVIYLDPLSTEWIDPQARYSDFLHWTLTDDLAGFYGQLRWEGWEEDARVLAGDQSFCSYPFLSAVGPPLEERQRSTVPVPEAFSFACELAQFFAGGEEVGGN